jgi:hypothetical protein
MSEFSIADFIKIMSFISYGTDYLELLNERLQREKRNELILKTRLDFRGNDDDMKNALADLGVSQEEAKAYESPVNLEEELLGFVRVEDQTVDGIAQSARYYSELLQTGRQKIVKTRFTFGLKKRKDARQTQLTALEEDKRTIYFDKDFPSLEKLYDAYIEDFKKYRQKTRALADENVWTIVETLRSLLFRYTGGSRQLTDIRKATEIYADYLWPSIPQGQQQQQNQQNQWVLSINANDNKKISTFSSRTRVPQVPQVATITTTFILNSHPFKFPIGNERLNMVKIAENEMYPQIVLIDKKIDDVNVSHIKPYPVDDATTFNPNDKTYGNQNVPVTVDALYRFNVAMNNPVDLIITDALLKYTDEVKAQEYSKNPDLAKIQYLIYRCQEFQRKYKEQKVDEKVKNTNMLIPTTLLGVTYVTPASERLAEQVLFIYQELRYTLEAVKSILKESDTDQFLKVWDSFLKDVAIDL